MKNKIKKFESTSSLIKILKEKKKVEIKNEGFVVQYFLKNSYYNFINSTKIHFVDYDKSNKKVKVYKDSKFEEWFDTYEGNIKIERKLLDICLREEECLTNFIGNLVHENLDNIKFKDIIFKKLTTTKIVKKKFSKEEAKEKSYKDEVLKSTWAYIHEVMLGDKIEIINSMDENNKKKLNDLLIVNIDKELELEAFKDIRNSLAHNTPLNIYITSSPQGKYKARKKIVNKLSNKKESGIKSSVSKNLKLCDKYVRLK